MTRKPGQYLGQLLGFGKAFVRDFLSKRISLKSENEYITPRSPQSRKITASKLKLNKKMQCFFDNGGL